MQLEVSTEQHQVLTVTVTRKLRADDAGLMVACWCKLNREQVPRTTTDARNALEVALWHGGDDLRERALKDTTRKQRRQLSEHAASVAELLTLKPGQVLEQVARELLDGLNAESERVHEAEDRLWFPDPDPGAEFGLVGWVSYQLEEFICPPHPVELDVMTEVDGTRFMRTVPERVGLGSHSDQVPLPIIRLAVHDHGREQVVELHIAQKANGSWAPIEPSGDGWFYAGGDHES